MRIALVVHDFNRAFGQGRYTYELARRFARDHEVHIFANTVDREGADGVVFHHVPAVRSNALATVLTFLVPATLRIGRHWDIIHAQGAAALRFNVITAHICNAAWASAQRSAPAGRTWRQRTFESVVTPIERATYRHSTGAEVIAISHLVKRDLGEYYGRTERVDVIHHGVDLDAFSPLQAGRDRAEMRAELGLREATFAALYVGDLRKGAATALDAIARVPEARLVLVTRSDPASYLERAALLGVADRVSFRPATSRIERYYAAADAFLFPSPYDAFGMVVTEAMATGIPVIASSRAGASEVIEHGRTGFVVDDSSGADQIASHLTRLIGDPAGRAAMARAARDAMKAHDWDTVAAQTLRVYDRARVQR